MPSDRGLSLIVSICLAALLACGGGGNSGGTGGTVPPPPPSGTLTLSPTAASVAPGASVRLDAGTVGVTGASSYAWGVLEAGMGTVAALGDGKSATYTAPTTLGTYHVQVSTVPAGLTASTEVKVGNPDDSSFFRIQTSPYKMTLKVNESSRARVKSRGRKEFLPPGLWRASAALDLVDVPVVWSIAEGALGGTVVPDTGVYTAPSKPGVFHLVATAIENPRVQGSVEVRVFADTPPSLPLPVAAGSVTTRPNLAYLEPLDQTFLKAVAANTASPAINWSLVEGAVAGSLSASTGGADNEVVFSANTGAGTFHALATAASEPAAQAQTTLQVGQRAGLTIVPGLLRLAPGGSADLQALVSDTTLLDVVWSSPDPTGGTLGPNGLRARYTAPTVPGVYYAAAQPKADLEKRVLARIEVAGATTPSVQILPRPARIQPGTQLQLVAQVTGTPNTAVTWSSSAGSISADGLLSAPASLQTLTVTARAVADPTRLDTATITVANLPAFYTVPPVNANPAAAYSYTPAAAQPDGVRTTLSLVSGPAGATFSGGLLAWTPQPFQYGLENQFVLRATDDLGGVSEQRWTVNFRVSGQWRQVYHSLDGVVTTVPSDLSALTIAAHVPNGTGGFQTYAGTGTATGTFWIPGVPPGYYWFQKGASYDWTDTSRVDFRFDQVGRSTGFQTATLPTIATFNISGMAAWNVPLGGPYTFVPPQLAWYDPNNPSNSGFDYLDNFLTPPLQAPGAVAMTGSLNLQSMFFPPNLSSTALGDRPIIIHYEAVSAPGGEWQAIVREAFQPPTLTMVNGTPFTISGAFSRSYPQVLVDLSMDVAPLAALRAVAAPAAATIRAYQLFIDAELPSGRSDLIWLQNAATPPLHQLAWGPAAPPTGIIATGPTTTLNFFPSGYVLYGVFQAAWRMQYLLPGTTTSFRWNGVVQASIPGTTGTIQLTHRPATLRINGAIATTDLTGVGLAPVFRVVADPFTAGNAPARLITIRRLGVNGSTTISETSFFLFHFPINEDFRLPPGILEAGRVYVIAVGMNSAGTGGATTISGLIRP